MDLSILDKIILILKYFTSSFLGIEVFITIAILLTFLILNIKKNNDIVKIGIPIFITVILLFISGGFHDYARESIDAFIKMIMNYYYFPSIALYYIIILFVSIILIYTILNEKIPKIKKTFNYVLISLINLLFLGLSSYIISNGLELILDNSIYSDDLILSFIQLSNLLLLLWIIVTVFYYFYKYLKRKFDK